jgi:hypothetical protein
MPVFKDTIMIKDTPWDRAVEVVVIYPEDESVLNVQKLAQRAWQSPSKEITVGGITVKVRAFRR